MSKIEEKKGGDLKFAKILRAGIMVVVYLGVALLIQFSSVFDGFFSVAPSFLRTGMALVFGIYGLFRSYRLWKTL